MATEVILLTDIKGLGNEGDVVRVADGYARNYLIPQQKAAQVTEATRRKLEKKRKERAAQQAAERAAAEQLAAKLAQMSCTISVKTGEGGKIFGSVTAIQIADALKAQGVDVAKNQIQLDEPLREAGVFTVPIKLSAGVEASVKVWIVGE
jgi:large subunit ribosomal protein L9